MLVSFVWPHLSSGDCLQMQIIIWCCLIHKKKTELLTLIASEFCETLLIDLYLCINLVAALLLNTTLAVGNSTSNLWLRVYTLRWFSSLGRSPAKSSWTSSFGSTVDSIWSEWVFPKNGLKFLPRSVHCRQFRDNWTIDLCMCVNQMGSQRSIIAADLGSMRWMLSNNVCLSWIEKEWCHNAARDHFVACL